MKPQLIKAEPTPQCIDTLAADLENLVIVTMTSSAINPGKAAAGCTCCSSTCCSCVHLS